MSAFSVKALTREISPRIVNCELTHLDRDPIDLARAAHQHHEYEKALIALGCTIEELPPLPDFADSVFVEDTAIVLPELAIIARPGAASRRDEVSSVADALKPNRPIAFIDEPGTLDGGDVLVVGSNIYVGHSTRTNEAGIQQLTVLSAPHGYKVHALKVSACLHLKSAVTRVAEDTVLLNPDWIDTSLFRGLRTIEVHHAEPLGANALLIGRSVVYSMDFVKTRKRLEKAGIEVHPVDLSELQKAEGAVTCCSILVETPP